MAKFNRSASRVRTLVVLPVVMATALLAACEDDGVQFPSTQAVDDVLVQKVPQGAPSLLINEYGDTLRLLGVPVDADARFVDAPVTWSVTGSPAVEIVTRTGADGRSYGVLRFVASPSFANPTNVDTVTVTASAAGQSGTISVIVRENPRVENVNVSNASPFQAAGATVTLTATSVDGFGNPIPAPNPYTWEVSPSGVVDLVDNADGTATLTYVAPGTATVSASVQNAGEPAATGTITGTRSITMATPLTSGATITIPNTPANAIAYYSIVVPAGSTQLQAQIAALAGATGDGDIYVWSPGTIPTLSNFVCRPWLFGSNETCTIATPAAGVWGIGVHAYPDDGDMANVSLTATVN